MRLAHAILRCLEAHAGPRTIDGIARDTGLSRRAVEAEIEDLRLEGHPIVADAEGIQLTEDPDELQAYIRSRRHRELRVALGTRALMRTERRLRHPLTLWGAA